jgi:iron complex outermembrane receptor protein
MQHKGTSRAAALGGAALAALIVGAARAEEQPAEAGASQADTVVVTGRRVSEAASAIGTDQTRNTISITQEALLSAPSGISGLKMLESLPGFNVQANDALGLYEFGNSVFVRAFGFRQIGFVLDNIPMGRADQFGGSPIFRYVDNENLGRIVASPGAGDVALPSYSSLGPMVSYFTNAPSGEFGGTVGITTGSDNLLRSFVRLETGTWNGFSAYVSRSKIDSDLWRGPGTIDREHIEAKIQYDHDNGATVAFNFVYNDFFDYDTPAISRAQYLGTTTPPDLFGRKGRFFPYLGTVPNLPVTVPGIPFSNTAHNQYFEQAVNDRRDILYGLTAELPVTDALTVKSTVYYEDKTGFGTSPEAYATSLTAHNAQRLIIPGLFAPRGLQYGLSTVDGTRLGLITQATLEAGAHTLNVGLWVEDDDYTRGQARYNMSNGDPAGRPLLNEPVHLQRLYTSTRDTTQIWLKDTISLFDNRVSLELGAKALQIDYEISGFRLPSDYINRRQPRIPETYEDFFLPQIGLVWNITRMEQFFVSYAENFAFPQGADDIFSLASPAAPNPAAEESKNFEIGLRANHPTFNGAIAAYFTTFDNRLQSFASPVPGSTQTETFFQNVGTVESYGVELSGVWKPSDLFYFNANVTYNIAEFKDDIPRFSAGNPLRIAGNRLPDNAEWLIQAGVTVEPFPWLVANLSARYLSERFTNFINTEETSGYTVLNAYLDIGDEFAIGPLKNVRARLNVDNLTDEDYLGTITTSVTGLATFRPGPPRTFQFTLSTDF